MSRMWHRTAAALTLALLIVAQMAPARAAESAAAGWVASWAASPMRARGDTPGYLTNLTIRQTVQVSLGGEQVRVRLSNEFGARPLVIGAASVALAQTDGTIIPGTLRPLTFDGARVTRIPPGAPMVSDPVALNLPALSSLAISLFLPQASEAVTIHADARQTARISPPGNFTDRETMPLAGSAPTRFFLTGVEVAAPAATKVVVALGDSITDGAGSTADTNRRWPDHLAHRLLAQGNPQRYAVVNAGISGNRLLHDGDGPSALARFDRDVLSWTNATHVIVMLGLNDIGWPGALAPLREEVSVAEVIAAHQQLIARARGRGLKVIGATLTPCEDTTIAGYVSPAKEAKRQAVNRWIREGAAYDGVIDFEAVLRDPARPTRLRPAFDSGDRLHPNDTGYRAMGEGVDLGLFK